MIKLGITGTIGSGKTVVSKIFESMNIPVYFSDQEAKRIMLNDKIVIKALIKRFGNQVYSYNGINRIFLVERIFNNEDDRLFVNTIVHPTVITDFLKWAKASNSKIVIIESALLFESGLYHHLNRIIMVQSPVKLAAQRISKRDNISIDEAEKKIKLQMQNYKNLETVDYFIENDNKHSLLNQCIEILDKIGSN